MRAHHCPPIDDEDFVHEEVDIKLYGDGES